MKRAILFLNLGGPEKLSDVKDFLYRLFEDPEIIRVKFSPLRKLIAWAISTSREKKSQALYALIGGGSPIRKLTDEQSQSVEELLRREGKEVLVRTAFTCSEPLVENVVAGLVQDGVNRFLIFPLYPQYSFTTAKGAIDRSRKAIRAAGSDVVGYEMSSFPTHPLFLAAHVDLIQSELKKFSDPRPENIHLVFSAHSIPKKLVSKEGDPYEKEMNETVRGVLSTLAWKGPWRLSWQSKLGPVEWLSPSTEETLVDLAKEGAKEVLVVPIAFVTDHIETLVELDQELAGVAKEKGIREYRRARGLNNHPQFIQALADLARSKKEFWS